MTLQKKRMMTSVVFAVGVVAVVAFAGNVTLPNTFAAGTPAVAAQVNANFAAVKTAVDDNQTQILTKQARVAGTCSAGFAVTTVNADGSVVCGATGGAYVAGAGLSLTGSTFAVAFGGNGVATTASRSDHTHGTIFTHWGMQTCPTGDTVLYKGFAAAGPGTGQGGISNQVCLTDAPIWTTPSNVLMTFSDLNQNGALLYGTEFFTTGYGALTGLDGSDGWCAVCMAPANNNFMLAGAATCPTNWKTEYYGYLMSNHYTWARTEAVCVDATTTPVGTVTRNNAGAGSNGWFPTETECGSLPCPAGGYVQDREVTCALCTQ